MLPLILFRRCPGVRSPSAFIELSVEHARKQLASLTEQAKATRDAGPEGIAYYR
jgi:hypothetical protein